MRVWLGLDTDIGVGRLRRLEPRQPRAQRIKARGVRTFVVFDGALDCRCYHGKLVVGEVNCRHGLDIIGLYLSSKERVDVYSSERAVSELAPGQEPGL